MAVASVFIALIGFVAFRHWLRHQRRVLIHRERMAALEKGVELPAVEQEVKRSGFNVQRLLLLAGLIWLTLGIGFGVLAVGILLGPGPRPEVFANVPPAVALAGLIPAGIGIAHIIVYLVGQRERKSVGLSNCVLEKT